MNLQQTIVSKLDHYQQKHRLPAFMYAVIKKYGDDNAGYQAALLTYYGFLALFPLLLLVTTLTRHLIGNNPELQERVIDGLTNYFPMMGDQLSEHVGSLSGSGFALLAGILFALYGARGVADVFRLSVQRMWRVPKRKREGWPVSLYKSLAIIIIGGTGFIAASVLATFVATAGNSLLFNALSIGVNLFIFFWIFVFLLNFSLPQHISLREARIGAAVAALGLVVLQLLGGYIISHELKRLDALYSYFAIALGLLFWLYLQAQVVMYAAEIAVVGSKKLWPRSLNASTPTPIDTRLELPKDAF